MYIDKQNNLKVIHSFVEALKIKGENVANIRLFSNNRIMKVI